MGHLKLQSCLKATREEPSDSESINKSGALACMINSKVAAVLAVMRRNVRWAGGYMAGDDQLEHILIQNLKALRKQIFSWKYPTNTINPIIYLQPFLDVIRSDETGAPVTAVALSSIYEIFTLDIFGLDTVNVVGAMHSVVEAVTNCCFEVTDPTSEEIVLMKILQVLLCCMKSRAYVVLSDQHVCSIVNTCFHIVHQAGTKGELLQQIARDTMRDVMRCVFSHLPDIDKSEDSLENGSTPLLKPVVCNDTSVDRSLENGNDNSNYDARPVIGGSPSKSSVTNVGDKTAYSNRDSPSGLLATEPFGIPCMVEIFQYLCSLLDSEEEIEVGLRSNIIAYSEDIPLFALGLINSAIELGGASIKRHPKLLSLVQDELFHNLIQFGLSTSPLILSRVCSIVFILYHNLRTELKLQLEAFFSCAVLRLGQSKSYSSYEQQEVIMEAIVDFCRPRHFMDEMYANLDCDIMCSNVFQDLANFLSKSAFPVNCPLSAMHVLAVDGLIAVIQEMGERIGNGATIPEVPLAIEEYSPFWTEECENYSDPSHWVSFVRRRKHIKKKLAIGAHEFNQDPKKGLEYLQLSHLLPGKLDPQSVASFFRYTNGLDKNLVGAFLGNHDEFSVQVLREFANTFDFQDMNLDTALRLLLETFRLPGESQKIQRVLEAFSERYYEQSPHILANKDVAFVLSYSLIMLNTDQHNVQVKKKMTEEDFIRNNRRINGGNDLPREFLSELYHSICKNEIRMTPEQGAGLPGMSPSRWFDLMCKSKRTAPFIICDDRAHLDLDMFAIMSQPTIAAINVVFDHTEQEDVLNTCMEGFLAMAKISSCYHLGDVLDHLVRSLCRYTNLLNPSSVDDPEHAFVDDVKARMATETVFIVANRYGDHIRTGWRNIVDCILMLHKLKLLPARIASDATDYSDMSTELAQGMNLMGSSLSASHIASAGTSRRPSGWMGRFSQLLSFDIEEPRLQLTEEQLAAHQQAVQSIQRCHIDSIFTKSKFLQEDSLLYLVKALIRVAGKPQKGQYSTEGEDTAVFWLELLIAVTINNRGRDRINFLWQEVYKHIASIVESRVMPCALVAVYGLLRMCQRLLPHQENMADELLKSLQLILQLDATVAEDHCKDITLEVMRLVKANATHIHSQMGWQNITSLLSITAAHPDASEPGFEALLYIMSDGAHLSPANFGLCVDACLRFACVDASRLFAESQVGLADRSIRALDLMTESVASLVQWSREGTEAGEIWLRLVQGLRIVCVDKRENVRNHAVSCLQRCLIAEGICVDLALWLHCFDQVIFAVLDDLLETAQGHSRECPNMEQTFVLALKLLSKVFLQLLNELSQEFCFCNLLLSVLGQMEKYKKAKVRRKKSGKLLELVPELQKNILLVMKAKGVLVPRTALEGDSLRELLELAKKDSL